MMRALLTTSALLLLAAGCETRPYNHCHASMVQEDGGGIYFERDQDGGGVYFHRDASDGGRQNICRRGVLIEPE